MLFNSYVFALFLLTVFVLYWFVFNRWLRAQNLLIVVASYFFYGWWDWRFLSLIFLSSLADYTIGILLAEQTDDKIRKMLLILSLGLNLGLLGTLKYFNFFIQSFSDAFSVFGLTVHTSTLNIVLPVGLSFYTFQTLSYSIDVYRKKQEPTKDIVAFFAYVSFFPQLVAGPIERAKNFLPQFHEKRSFEYDKAADGLRQILLGLLKKIVIADNCAVYVNDIFANYQDYSGSTLILGSVLFAFQIYGDFSGYSDIAIGTARLFGFNLMRNFAYPYFSRDIAEFWRRWHISLSSWFKDYVYIPLGGSRCSTMKKVRNIFIIFLISGFWHGANWTFIAWGFLNALFFMPLMFLNKHRVNLEHISKERFIPHAGDIAKILTTFALTCLGWIFFRAESMTHAIGYLKRIISWSTFSVPQLTPMKLFGFIIVLTLIEWFQRDQQHAFAMDGNSVPKVLRWSFYYATVILIFIFGNFSSNYDFIYFQF